MSTNWKPCQLRVQILLFATRWLTRATEIRPCCFGANRPQNVAQDGGQARVGATGLYTHQNGPLSQMSQLRPRRRISAFENRVSRVSFVDDLRPHNPPNLVVLVPTTSSTRKPDSVYNFGLGMNRTVINCTNSISVSYTRNHRRKRLGDYTLQKGGGVIFQKASLSMSSS